MPTFEIELGGKTFDVEAPDMQTAAKSAQTFQQQDQVQRGRDAQMNHPWARFQRAARAGQMPEPGKMYPDNGPGSSYMPTPGENAKQLGTLGAMIAAGPVATAATGSTILAPAVARTAVSAAPDLLTGDTTEALKKGLSTAGLETLFSLLGVPGKAFSAWRSKGVPGPAVHQAANFEKPTILYGPSGQVVSQKTPPITFNRAGGGQVSVQPPSSGQPITGGSSPGAILQEPLTPARSADVGQGVRTVADMAASQYPDPVLGGLAGVFSKVKGLWPFAAEHAGNPRY